MHLNDRNTYGFAPVDVYQNIDIFAEREIISNYMLVLNCWIISQTRWIN